MCYNTCSIGLQPALRVLTHLPIHVIQTSSPLLTKERPSSSSTQHSLGVITPKKLPTHWPFSTALKQKKHVLCSHCNGETTTKWSDYTPRPILFQQSIMEDRHSVAKTKLNDIHLAALHWTELRAGWYLRLASVPWPWYSPTIAAHTTVNSITSISRSQRTVTISTVSSFMYTSFPMVWLRRFCTYHDVMSALSTCANCDRFKATINYIVQRFRGFFQNTVKVVTRY